tara:strand:+ start:3547 stop:4509 length:963 start_codon:yes stop_codon:yes gene_type:complete
MKMVKPLMAILFAFALVIPIQANNTDGHLQCDPDKEYPEAAPGEGEGCGNYLDCNENGVYDVGEPCEEGGQHDGPPPGEEGGQHDGPPPAGGECHCGHVFGENDQHGHCRDCDEALNGDADWDDHCSNNPDHCGPKPGDECQCGHVFGENDQHGHCPTCDEALNGDADWDDHCSNNPDHCGPPPGGDEGPVRFEEVGDGDNCINDSEAYDTFGQEETMEEFKSGNDEDPGFDYWASKDSNDDECGDAEVNRKEFFKATYRGLNQMNDEQDMGMGQASLANCAAWCAGIPNYKTKDENGEWSDSFARYDDEGCPCYPHDGN